MIVMTETEKLRIISELLNQESELSKLKDVSMRTRDQKGRFRKESRRQVASKYGSVREIKLVKVKGSYGTFLVKTRLLSEEDRVFLWSTCVVAIMAYVF